MSKPLTAKQAEVLRYIAESIAARGIPPTLADISARLHLASTNAAREHVTALVRKGYLARDAGKARALRVLRRAAVRAEAFIEPRDAVTGTVRVVLPRGDGVALYWQIKTNEAAECAA